MSDLFNTGVIPLVNQYLQEESEKVRSYGDYWSASSAGYCMRKVIFDRLKVPQVTEDARKQRVFSSGHIFHEWIQGLTKAAGISVAQEVELQDEKLMVRGHFDDLVLIKEMGGAEAYDALDKNGEYQPDGKIVRRPEGDIKNVVIKENLILYDYKTQNSQAFSWMKKQPERKMSHYHTMQLGTYMYMLRKNAIIYNDKTWTVNAHKAKLDMELVWNLKEARILKISKDDLRMAEEQLLWTPDLEKKVVEYWTTLNGYWREKKIPSCTCAKYEINQKTGKGFMADPRYNPYFYNNEPCSIEWLKRMKKEGKVDW